MIYVVRYARRGLDTTEYYRTLHITGRNWADMINKAMECSELGERIVNLAEGGYQ